jgi:hypothetical protein
MVMMIQTLSNPQNIGLSFAEPHFLRCIVFSFLLLFGRVSIEIDDPIS